MPVILCGDREIRDAKDANLRGLLDKAKAALHRGRVQRLIRECREEGLLPAPNNAVLRDSRKIAHRLLENRDHNKGRAILAGSGTIAASLRDDAPSEMKTSGVALLEHRETNHHSAILPNSAAIARSLMS